MQVSVKVTGKYWLLCLLSSQRTITAGMQFEQRYSFVVLEEKKKTKYLFEKLCGPDKLRPQPEEICMACRKWRRMRKTVNALYREYCRYMQFRKMSIAWKNGIFCLNFGFIPSTSGFARCLHFHYLIVGIFWCSRNIQIITFCLCVWKYTFGYVNPTFD